MNRPTIDTRDLDPHTCPFKDMTTSDGVLAMRLRDDLELRHEQAWASLEEPQDAGTPLEERSLSLIIYQGAVRDLARWMVCGIDPELRIGDPRRNLCDPFDLRPLYRIQSAAKNEPDMCNHPNSVYEITGGYREAEL